MRLPMLLLMAMMVAGTGCSQVMHPAEKPLVLDCTNNPPCPPSAEVCQCKPGTHLATGDHYVLAQSGKQEKPPADDSMIIYLTNF